MGEQGDESWEESISLQGKGYQTSEGNKRGRYLQGDVGKGPT